MLKKRENFDQAKTNHLINSFFFRNFDETKRIFEAMGLRLVTKLWEETGKPRRKIAEAQL